jgi:hypothetical protein
MTDDTTPSVPEPVPAPPVIKDECYPLLTLIQWLMLWAERQGLNTEMSDSNSYEWPPSKPPEPGQAIDIDHYYTQFILKFPRVMDWNMPAQLPDGPVNAAAQMIVDYIKDMKPATGGNR